MGLDRLDRGWADLSIGDKVGRLRDRLQYISDNLEDQGAIGVAAAPPETLEVAPEVPQTNTAEGAGNTAEDDGQEPSDEQIANSA